MTKPKETNSSKLEQRALREAATIRENMSLSDINVPDVNEEKDPSFEERTTNIDPLMEERFRANRIYKGEIDVDHDLFKLEVASMKKNVSIDTNSPLYIGVEHCHFFHSFDSSGKKQATSSPIAGHSHKVTTKVDEKGNLVAVCGPAIRKAGSSETVVDDHWHEVTYLRSERLTVRKVNAEAQKAAVNKSSAMQGHM